MLRSGAAAVAGLAMTSALPTGMASAKTAPAGPVIKLVAAQNNVAVSQIDLGGGHKVVFLDPGVFVAAFGSQLRFDVQRASYAKPAKITEVISEPGHPAVRRPLPDSAELGWMGLHQFLRMTVKNAAGKIMGNKLFRFCPDSFSPQRTGPLSPTSQPFPNRCLFNPFQRSSVWGIQRDWGSDPFSKGFAFSGPEFALKLGHYSVTVSITTPWRRILHVQAGAATATVGVDVVKSTCSSCDGRRATQAERAAGAAGATGKQLPSDPASVPVLKDPPASDRPDLATVPSDEISTRHSNVNDPVQNRDLLQFNATVWTGGNATLDVEGFRSHGSPIMPAFQYFWHHGKIVGRARVGTMGFESGQNENHWHFEEFAQYRLLNSAKALAVPSKKVGFCIAPTDGIDLASPHSVWQPPIIFSSEDFGNVCGSVTSLWVREMLPIGWGDTYVQQSEDEAFDITNLPNGTYYIQIIANPQHKIFETNYRNDSSLRKVIIGGTPGHRTVNVPAVHGIDPEHMG
jgi:hypothetical protein